METVEITTPIVDNNEICHHQRFKLEISNLIALAKSKNPIIPLSKKS